MSPRPYRPLKEFEHYVQRGRLDMAAAVAKDYANEEKRPIPLQTAMTLLPLAAIKRVDVYDSWACHWLKRWLDETREPTIERASQIAVALAELPLEPQRARQELDELGL